MKQTRLIMGMPVTVELLGVQATSEALEAIFAHFERVDARYSTYKPNSEVSRLNDGLPETEWSDELKDVLVLCEQTRRQTQGYFNAYRDGYFDPSGLVKGWAIRRAAAIAREYGIEDYYIEAGGDIQVSGRNGQGRPWRIGVRNPFQRDQLIKVVALTTGGIATSGTAVRGQHVYNPHRPGRPLSEIASLTVIGPNIYEADRYATAAFAMGEKGIEFIESVPGLEGYMVASTQQATFTPGFEKYVAAA